MQNTRTHNLLVYFSNLNILSQHQHGFWTGRSCDTQLLGAINDFHHCLDTGSHIDTLFLNFSKGFGKVSHRKLCHKLSHYEINGNLFHWIKAYLTDQSQSVLLEGKSNASHPVYSGLSTSTTFIIYINNTTESITSTIRLYADYVLIYRIINTDADAAYLQNDLCTLENWANIWQMKFNPSKCVHQTITRKKSHIHFCYQIHGQHIQQNRSAKYLGVVINEHLSWKELHVNNICAKGKVFLQHNLYHCPASLKSTCYTSMVRPIATRICGNSVVPAPAISEVSD